MHAGTFENHWYLFPFDHLLKKEKYFAVFIYLCIHYIGFWRSFREDDWRQTRRLSDRKGICTQRVFFLPSELISVLQSHTLLTEPHTTAQGSVITADLARIPQLRAAEL